jgi:hypothetical protein
MTYEKENGMTLGALESFLPQHIIATDESLSVGRLAVVLEWQSKDYERTGKGSRIQAPIVRGAPYTSMKYFQASPHIHVERALAIGSSPIADGKFKLVCGQGHGVFSKTSFRVERELEVQFEISDMTWLIFFSEPVDVSTNPTSPLGDACWPASSFLAKCIPVIVRMHDT